MFKRNGLRTYCFSPPVMIFTAFVELALMMYAISKYRSTKLGRLAIVTLFCLAIFQIAEYNLCGGMGLNASAWSRLGFMIIALLPPLGIHISLTIAKASWKWLLWLAYVTAGVWIAVFGFTERMFANHVCSGNYIIFSIKPYYGGWYTLYYYFWLFTGIGLALWLTRKVKIKQKESLLLLVVGYLVFMVPTALLNSINSQTVEGLPSILCGFAIFFAILLAFGILPNELNRPSKKMPTIPLLHVVYNLLTLWS